MLELTPSGPIPLVFLLHGSPDSARQSQLMLKNVAPDAWLRDSPVTRQVGLHIHPYHVHNHDHMLLVAVQSRGYRIGVTYQQVDHE